MVWWVKALATQPWVLLSPIPRTDIKHWKLKINVWSSIAPGLGRNADIPGTTEMWINCRSVVVILTFPDLISNCVLVKWMSFNLWSTHWNISDKGRWCCNLFPNDLEKNMYIWIKRLKTAAKTVEGESYYLVKGKWEVIYFYYIILTIFMWVQVALKWKLFNLLI